MSTSLLIALLATTAAADKSPAATKLTCPLSTDFCEFTPDSSWAISGGEAVTSIDVPQGGTITSPTITSNGIICFQLDYRLVAVEQPIQLQVQLFTYGHDHPKTIFLTSAISPMDYFITAGIDVPPSDKQQQLLLQVFKSNDQDRVHLRNFNATDGDCR